MIRREWLLLRVALQFLTRLPLRLPGWDEAWLNACVRHFPLVGALIVAGVLLVLMGCYLAGWLNALALLERAGHGMWRHVQGVAARLMPVDRLHKALLAGMAWGWLPCGLVYSTLTWAGTSGSAARGALLMLAFGLGTLPAVVASGALANELRALLQRRGLRVIAGLLVIAFGVWTLAIALPHGQGPHALHHHH